MTVAGDAAQASWSVWESGPLCVEVCSWPGNAFAGVESVLVLIRQTFEG